MRPLRQSTGEAEFAELFFRDVRVPAENVLGAAGNGWNVALGTLAHERATLGVSAQISIRRQIDRLIELSRTVEFNGHAAAEDPIAREKIAQSYIENEVLRLNQMRAVSRIIQTGAPGPEGSILKLNWSEANQRFQIVAQEILGPYAQLTAGSAEAIDNGGFAHSYLRARGNTIEAGTSEIQRNIIGQHVLGLPKSY